MTRCAECILHDVARSFGVSPGAIRATRRTGDVVPARFAAYRLLRMEAGLTTAQIGRIIGNRDHSTICSGIASAENLLRTDAEFVSRYAEAMG